MGYRAYHNLTIEVGTSGADNPNEELIISQLCEEYEGARDSMDEDGTAINDTSWQFEEDMRAFSKKHPDVLFCMSTEGSEGDYTKTYFKDGKTQECYGEIVYPDYDESKLQ